MAILRTIGKSHVFEVLESIHKQPRRFVDLKYVCRSTRTRSGVLKLLRKEGLVEVVPKIQGSRAYLFYQLTPLGKQVFELSNDLMRIKRDYDKNCFEKSSN